MIITIKGDNWYYYCILMIISMKYWVNIMIMCYNINWWAIINGDYYYCMKIYIGENNIV